MLHLGVGGEGKQTRLEMRPTKENLEKVQKKRQFVRFTSRIYLYTKFEKTDKFVRTLYTVGRRTS